MALLDPADYSGLVGRPGEVEGSIQEATTLIERGLPDGADWVTFVLDDPERRTPTPERRP